jgi:hypothetical protein
MVLSCSPIRLDEMPSLDTAMVSEQNYYSIKGLL